MSRFLPRLVDVIGDRKRNPKVGSYTNVLLDDPVRAAQKVGEEANEVVVAALAQSDERLVAEMADLVYHSLVLLAAHDLSWEDVEAELEKRHRP
jgi:phosphoribosyl-ATP pyrophosphohydrolase/phosphoribosyl-AMP cyclohydrolase